jgi:AcrR family transcriptional regulator
VESAKRLATHEANRARVKDTARQLLANQGAASLSLREVAREMNQTSSALYRYFANRDELLTALILDAYNELGASVERAEARVPRWDRRARWVATCGAVRRWAKRHPHEYALIFGSPVPGYTAPAMTVAAATRTTIVMAGIVAEQYRDAPPSPSKPRVERALEWETVQVVLPLVPPDIVARAIIAWTQVFGAVSFELFGHYVGSVRNATLMFDLMVDEMANLVGIMNDQ